MQREEKHSYVCVFYVLLTFFFCVKSSSFNTTSHLLVKKNGTFFVEFSRDGLFRMQFALSRRFPAFAFALLLARGWSERKKIRVLGTVSRNARVKFFLSRGLCEMCSNASASFGPRAVGKYANVVLPSNARSVWAFGISRTFVSGAETCAHFSFVFSRSPNLYLLSSFSLVAFQNTRADLCTRNLSSRSSTAA